MIKTVGVVLSSFVVSAIANATPNDLIIHHDIQYLISEDGIIYQRGINSPWGESPIQLPEGVKAVSINIADPRNKRIVYVLGDDGKLYYRHADKNSFEKTPYQLPLSKKEILPESERQSVFFTTFDDGKNQQLLMIPANGKIYTRKFGQGEWKEHADQLSGTKAVEVAAKVFNSTEQAYYIIGEDGNFYFKKPGEKTIKKSNTQLPGGVKPFASAKPGGSTLATPSGHNMFVIGENGLIYERDSQNPWGESSIQLPDGIQARTIVYWNVTDKNGNHDLLYVTGNDGKLYYRKLPSGQFELSATQLPGKKSTLISAVWKIESSMEAVNQGAHSDARFAKRSVANRTQIDTSSAVIAAQRTNKSSEANSTTAAAR